MQHWVMISKDCRYSQQQENILASHGVRVAQVPLSSSPARLQDKQQGNETFSCWGRLGGRLV